MSSTKKIPKLITVDLESGEILIDGEILPWYIQDGWTVTGDRCLSYLTVTLLADAVEVKPVNADRVRDLTA